MNSIRKKHRIILASLLIIGVFLLQYAATQQSNGDFFTLIVLPDTQKCTDSSFGGKPEYFYKQTQWIKDNKEKLHIAMVAHEGDMVQSFAQWDEQWKVVDRAFQTIDSEAPYIVCLGNHDIAGTGKNLPRGIDERHTLLNDYFPPSRFVNNPLYSRNFGQDKNAHFLENGRSDNYYLFFEGGGMKFIIISLEFKPRGEILSWANQITAQYPDRRCIILTHGYLDASKRLISMDNYKFRGSSGQQMWDNFTSRHENIFLVLCGHILGEALLTSFGRSGNMVHQVLADFQNDYIGNGGYGYLRIMRFFPEDDRIDVQTYSPVLDTFITTPRSQFSLEYRMRGEARAKTGS